jgi:hypothetical protein
MPFDSSRTDLAAGFGKRKTDAVPANLFYFSFDQDKLLIVGNYKIDIMVRPQFLEKIIGVDPTAVEGIIQAG